MNIDKVSLNRIINKINECAATIIEVLGCGFEEKVYQRALTYELSKQGFNLEFQYPINVYYDGIIVGDFYADIVVEESILVQIISVASLTEEYKKKCSNYLQASELKVCLLLNFGVPQLEIYKCE